MRLLSELLPDQNLSARARRTWMLILVLAPLAYLVGGWLLTQLQRVQGVSFEIGREQAIGIAREYASSLGWNVEDFQAFTTVETDKTLHFYYRSASSEFHDSLMQLRPEAVIRIVFLSGEPDRIFEARLGPDGSPLGFSTRAPDSTITQLGNVAIGVDRDADSPPKPAESPLDEDQQLAAAEFEKEAKDLGFLTFDPQPAVETERSETHLIRTFSWKGRRDEYPEVTVKLRYQVDDVRLVSREATVELDPIFVSERLTFQSGLKTAAWVLLGIVAAVLSIYAFVLYIRKALQKEVSHARTVAVGTVIAVSFITVAITTAGEQLVIQSKRLPTDPLLLAMLGLTSFGYLLVGFWVGMFWGSAEGEVRENYPGKLSALDALMMGKVFSKKVGRASVVGAALGGWLLLAVALAQASWIQSSQFGFGMAEYYVLLFSRFPGTLALLSPILASVPVVALGLLMPLTLAHRTFRSGRLRRIAQFGLTIVACSWIGLRINPMAASILVTLVLVVALITVFRSYDLLVCLAMLSTHGFVGSLAAMVTFTSVSWKAAIAPGLVFLGILIVHSCAAVWGKDYREEEIRPVYAENLAQRLSLQAEVSAAREAQLRLAPQRIPQLRAASLAACCQPGRVVGGDFYDFFPMASGNLGVFLAEGGGTGLSSALTIAYAKGLILPMVRQQPEPGDVVRKLLREMGPLIDSQEGEIGFMFGIMDDSERTFRFARHGRYPRLLAEGISENADESTVRLGDAAMTSGRVRLESRARLVLFTNGIADVLESSRTAPEDWDIRLLRSYPDASANELQQIFLSNLEPLIRQARRRGIEDDISAVFLRFEGAGDGERGV